jgi:hypothetical protein
MTTIFWRHAGDIAVLVTIDPINGAQYYPARRILTPQSCPLAIEADTDPVAYLQRPIFTSVGDPLPREEALRWYEEQSAFEPGFGIF